MSSLRAETAEEIIKKHIDAIGGADAWRKITAIRMEGTVTAQGNEIQVKVTEALHHGFRLDLSLMGMSGYSCYNTTEGWNYMPFRGQQAPEAMTADEVKQGQDDLNEIGDPFIHIKEDGTTAEYLGKEDVDGTECYKIKLNHKSGKMTTAFIDPSTYLCIRETEKSVTNGQVQEQSTDFSNFKKLPEGITVAMTIVGPFGPVTVKKIEVNPKLDDSLFKKS